VAECRATGDKKRLEEVLGTAFVMYLGISLIVLFATTILLFNIQRLFNFPTTQLPMAQLCLMILGINQAVAFLFTVQSTILFGAGRLDLMAGFGTLVGLALSITQATLAWRGYGIETLAAALVVSTVVGGLVGRRLISKYLPDIKIRPRAATKTMARELVKYGSRNSVISICGTIAFKR
jgi:Na+-driven multidrug efflux pump